MRLHVVPLIGTVRLRDLTDEHVWRVIAKMGENGAAKNSRKLVLTHISALCTWLVEDAKELRANPVAALSKTRRKRLAADASQDTHVKVIGNPGALLRKVDDDFALIVKTALLTGLRLAEVLGLRGCDIGDGTLRVDGQLDRKTRAHTSRVKTPSSRRTVRDVPAPLLAELRALASEDASALLFTGRDGRGRWSQVVERAFDRAVRDADLDESLHFHSTRHTFASRLIAEGRAPVYVQKQLGHSSLRTTLETYAHDFSLREEHDAAREAADAAYEALTSDRPVLRVVA
jgi:integrase